ncbi:MAG: phosphatidate cytidylyltransferase, partial [Gemmataceae bacterium]
MLKHRLIAGSLMAAGVMAILFGDALLSDALGRPVFPFLGVLAVTAVFFAARELVSIIPEPNRPHRGLCLAGVTALFAVHFVQAGVGTLPGLERFGPRSWEPVAAVFAGCVLAAFLVEMYRYTGSGDSVTRIAHAVLVMAYTGLLTGFFVKLRWLTPAEGSPHLPAVYLALAVFVPKCCDIAAYFVGRFLGRHPFTPRLSPKKTWEGFAGGFAGGVWAACVLQWFGLATGVGVVFRHGWAEAAAFGVVVGFFGVLGDLAESLVKRDGQTKDASQTVPGFGGLLDVFDSV